MGYHLYSYLFEERMMFYGSASSAQYVSVKFVNYKN